ncbi:MAG: PIN domain-containing protein [Actinophytocola sp.]|nr:PIN domain-containing protein [Actinophytocola sp.]
MTTPRRMLLDTSVIIDLERLDLGDYADVRAAVSAVTVAELAYGVDVSDPVERHARSERYQATINHFEVIPFDLGAAKLYGVLASLVRGSGRNPRPRRMDLQIAATAATHELPLLTRNGADFEGLQRVVDVVAM